MAHAVDFNLYQALRESRPLAAEHDGAPWRRLETVLDDVFDSLAGDVGDVAYDRDADRFDRTRLHEAPYEAVITPAGMDTATQERVIAALHAVYNLPSEDTATAAAEALEDMRRELAG